jgi:GAF domain-containing protein
MDGPVVCLKGLQGQFEGRTWKTAGPLKVGRLSKCALYLDDASVSRVHAEILDTDRGWVVRDLGSMNGSFLNGERVGPVEVPLREGDILQFGEVCLVVGRVRSSGQVGNEARYAWQVTAGEAGTLEEALQRLARVQGPAEGAVHAYSAFVRIGRTGPARSLTGYLEGILWEAAEVCGASLAALALVDGRTGSLELQASFDLETPSGPPAWVEPWVGQEAFAQGRSLLLVRDLDASFKGRPLHALLCGLLRSRGRNVGVVYLARARGQEPFGQTDLCRADALALSIGPSVEAFQLQFRHQEEQILQTLTTLTELIHLRASVSAGHPQRVTDYALLLAEELNLPPADRHQLRLGALLHDLGALGVPDAILHKAGPLTPEEVKELRAQFLKGVVLFGSLPSLVPLLPMVRNHREHWDGRGYPDGLAGPQIPLLARVVGLADAFDAMTTERPYRRAMPLDQVFQEVQRLSGTQFDPACVAALLRLRPHLEDLFEQRKHTTRTISQATMEAVRASLPLERGKSARSPAPLPEERGSCRC